jgi:hypothetical protein
VPKSAYNTCAQQLNTPAARRAVDALGFFKGFFFSQLAKHIFFISSNRSCNPDFTLI